MNAEKPTLKEFLYQFCAGINTEKDTLLDPFNDEEMVYATDAHILIRFDIKHLDFELIRKDKTPRASKVVPEANCSIPFTLTEEMFLPLKTEPEYRYTGKDVECTECEGSGVVEWEYKNHSKEFECPKCDEGLIAKRRAFETGNKTFPEYDCYVKLNGAFFNPRYVSKLLSVAEFTGEKITLTRLPLPLKISPALFQIGIFEVLIMPVSLNEVEEKEYNILELSI